MKNIKLFVTGSVMSELHQT